MWFLFPSSGHHSLCFMRFFGGWGVFVGTLGPAKLSFFVHINLTGKPGIHHESTNEQWDFQGPPIMGPLYGKFPILFPYHSHWPIRIPKDMGIVWETYHKGSHYWGSLKIPLKSVKGFPTPKNERFVPWNWGPFRKEKFIFHACFRW